MGYLTSQNKKECYGCYACRQICPKTAIVMKADQEGFEYPVINEALCVHCDLCKKVCPSENPQQLLEPRKTFALVQREDILKKSSSGGAFYTLLLLLKDNSVVYGCAWKNRSQAVILRTEKTEAFESFRKSKYVQSAVGDSYWNAKEDLEAGTQVFFVGTPCQIAGLKQFLGKDYENLLAVDLICHGVPSSKVLEFYLRDAEKDSNPINSIDFRHKKCVKGEWNSKLALLGYQNGKQKETDYDSSAFLRGYDNGLFFRPSCSVCAFASDKRVSDITIGDYWGGELQGFNPHKGSSLVLCNTKKGLAFCDKIEEKAAITLVDYSYAAAHNARLRSPDKGNVNRAAFFERLEKGESFTKIVQSYAPRVPGWKKVGHRIKTLIIKQ